MGVIGLVFRNVVRRRWPSLVLVAVMTALSSGFVLIAATGARRSATAWPRLTTRTYSPQVLGSSSVDDTETILAGLRAMPDVAAAAAFAWMPASPVGLKPEQGLFAGLGDGFGQTVLRPIIERGRRADPRRADEVTINDVMAKFAHLTVGSRTHLVGPSIEQDATVVGIHVSPLDIGTNGNGPSMFGTPAFMARWWPEIRKLQGSDALRPAIGTRLRAGADVDAFLARVAKAYPDAGFVGPQGLDADILGGLRVETNAFWVLTGAAALASLALIGLLAGRVLRAHAVATDVLAAMGVTRRERVVAIALPVLGAVVIGVAASPVIAAVASPAVRVGLARIADPARHAWFDGRVLVLGAVAMGVALGAVTLLAGWRLAALVGRSRPERSVRPSRLARVAGGSSAAIVGLASAGGGVQPATRRLARSTVVMSAAAIAAIVAVLCWTASIDHLTRAYRLQGWDFDAAGETVGGAESAIDQAAQQLLASPAVARLARYRRAQIPIGGIDADVFGLSQQRGSVHPTMRRGRAPVGPNEVALGSHTMARLHQRVGDRVDIKGSAGPVSMTIVGEAIFPLLGNDGWGDDVTMTAETYEALEIPVLASGFLIDFAPRADVKAIEQSVGGIQFTGPFSPPPITHVKAVTDIVGSLAAFFAALALVVFGYGVLTSARRQARDVAVLRTLGFRRRQVFAATAWQVGLMIATSVVAAIVLGVALGRLVWHLTSRNLAVLDAFTARPADVAVVVAGAAAAAAVVTLLAAWRPVHDTIARGLRTE